MPTQTNQATAYYNTFARAWELLLGALTAALVPHVRWPMWLRTALATIALAAILACGAVIDGVKQFPGPWALVPVVRDGVDDPRGGQPAGRSAGARHHAAAQPGAGRRLRSSHSACWRTRSTCGTGRC